MKKVFLLIFIAVTLFCIASCTLKSSNEEAVEGYSIEKFGLGIKMPQNLDLGDAETAFGVESGDFFELAVGGARKDRTQMCVTSGMGYYTDMDLCGAFTCLYTKFYAEGEYDLKIFLTGYWQAFAKSDLKGQNSGIKVKDLFLTEEQLKKYLIYEDDECVVYDFTSLILPTDFYQYVSSYLKPYQKYEWITKLHDYMENNEKKIICKNF
ncbi:MAG: hypothetical protein N2Z57_02870 [Oscillospiraceae bacterium]|nr:hypothetical protein [Oscillospiraceae bacterium]